MIAARAPMPPINGIGISKPKSARLGTVCIMLAKPSTGVCRDFTRVSRMPSGTPTTMARPVEIETRKMCSRVSASSSGQFDLKKLDESSSHRYGFVGIVGKNCGVTRPLVRCSNAYAYLISVGSLHAVPKKNMPVELFACRKSREITRSGDSRNIANSERHGDRRISCDGGNTPRLTRGRTDECIEFVSSEQRVDAVFASLLADLC